MYLNHNCTKHGCHYAPTQKIGACGKMIPLSGYVWEITSNKDEKWRVVSEGPNLEEAVTEFRRVHGYSTILFKVKYLKFRGEKEV